MKSGPVFAYVSLSTENYISAIRQLYYVSPNSFSSVRTQIMAPAFTFPAIILTFL